MDNVGLDVGLEALAGLLEEFGKGNIVDPRIEREVMGRHTKTLSQRWNHRFPDFPKEDYPFASLRGVHYRGKRDAYLKNIIVRLAKAQVDENKTIVNPACVIARHTRDLASRLKRFRVVGTDIDPKWNWVYERLRRSPDNFEFVQDNIFCPQLQITPWAVVFFGACGSVSDGALDYAIESHSPYLICRTCCHDNIGGNTEIKSRPTFVNWFFRFKNWGFARMREKKKYEGFYFSDIYSQDQYPRSEAARGLTNSDEYLQVSRNSVESDVCRAIIDLDRYLRLVEKEYSVLYRGELFVAERNVR